MCNSCFAEKQELTCKDFIDLYLESVKEGSLCFISQFMLLEVLYEQVAKEAYSGSCLSFPNTFATAEGVAAA